MSGVRPEYLQRMYRVATIYLLACRYCDGEELPASDRMLGHALYVCYTDLVGVDPFYKSRADNIIEAVRGFREGGETLEGTFERIKQSVRELPCS